jgi:hypothetical protein
MCHQRSRWRRAVAGSVCRAALTDRQAKLLPADAALPGGARDVGSDKATIGGVSVQAAARAWSYRLIDR